MAKIKYEIDNSHFFVNPYNFVSSDFSMPKSAPDVEDDKFLSGRIRCSLVTRTPLAIPDPERADAIKLGDGIHKIYPFFSIGNQKPVIPASSIRGPIRNVYETVTNSCYPTQDVEKSILSARSSVSSAKAGILERKGDGNWELYRADAGRFKPEGGFSAAWRSGKVGSVNEGDEITHDAKIGRKAATSMTGMLVIGEMMDGKKNVYIFEKGGLYTNCTVDELKCLVSRLEYNVKECYQDKELNTKYGEEHNGYRRYLGLLRDGKAPVWYRETGEDSPHITLSPACIGRNVFSKTENEILGTKGRCTKRAERCKACDLFGMIGDTNQSMGSKVRFSDAVCVKYEPGKKKYYRLRELAGPKNSYFPFYLKQPDFDTIGKTKYRSYYDSLGYDSPHVEIRGRKYYWHSDKTDVLNVPLKNSKDNSAEDRVPITCRNSTVETLAEGSEFEFDVFYDRITERQLYELIWSLNFWENDTGGCYCHKIGHGKPVGLGSVKITVSEIAFRVYDKGTYSVRTESFEKLDVSDPFGTISPNVKRQKDMASPRTIKELKTIANFNNKMDVDYPGVIADDALIAMVNKAEDDNALAAHNWFYQNKNEGKNPERGKFQPLPQILDEQGKWDPDRMKMKKYKAEME